MSKTKWYQKPIYLLIALALVLSLGIAAVPMAGTVEAAVINVPGNYPTIQQAVDNATAGDVIIVAAGTYYESITLKGGVQVLGAGADVTTIDGSTARGGQPAYHVVVGADNATLDGFTVTGGKATGGGIDDYGGGMLNNDSSPTVTNCSFSGNSASQGGGMYNWDNCSPTVTNCTFSGNSATFGGGMYNGHSSPTVTNCTFSGNSASRGGGMFNVQCSPAVTNCIFEGNSADGGGGMYNYNYTSPTVTNCTFSGNSAPYGSGGGMYNEDNCSPNVTNCIFEGNSANDNGGGMQNHDNCSPNVTNCIFEGNSADTGGGMCNWDNCSPTVTNCIFSGNSAYDGGGMCNLVNCSPTVTNCIFSGNSAYDGGGMCNYNNSSPAITNNIIVSNTAYQGGGIWADGSSSPTIDYNDVWNNSPDDYYGCSAGANDISQDPLFVNPAAGDYHPQLGSPCIDAGTNDEAPPDDIEGNPRPIDGNGDGWAITDMGAYEYVPPPPPAHFSYLHSEGSLIDLADPVGTQWHELWPFFCKGYHLSSWEDNGDGVLSRCDWIDMYQKPNGEVKWYHVENVTITLCLTHNETGEPKYIDLEGGYNPSVLNKPVGTQWHEIYPAFCREYQLSSWNDTDERGKLDFCDEIDLTDKETGKVSRWHVEDVATDIVVTPEPPPPPPPPVGGEAYPVNKVSLLAPWIAVAVLLAGGISWLTLRRRRAQS